MKEIKFRAWDKTNNEWYMNGDAFDLNFSGSYGDFFFDNDHPSNMRKVKLVWLQYIGRKDKNGVEIYKGSIIEAIITEHSISTMGEIIYDEEHSCYANKNEGGLTPLYKLSQLEVIGNIWEE